MTDLNWYQQQLRMLNERLWHLGAATRDVTAFEDDLRQVWNDSATRDLRGRLLQPLHEEHSAASTALTRKSTALTSMHGSLQRTQGHCEQVARFSEHIADRLDDTRREMERGHHERDWADQLTTRVLAATDRMTQLITEADQTLP
ncbi:hypothetical protein GCM10008959_41380 [Deinococcus seoulensis]|uniref:Uncharacterized protein n=1 Tax=Deinococcus seoulensis TaxID=1837379 RepID=A0ABQ2S0N9_9DEIO|nr:hypothetical protein [Deinococcus seoulensis]GGR76277.1 hypothetical protein GCM10008959_41380 [Deinococcus seoulensis]